MVLEREDRARARGATIYATIDGYGSTCDAYHRVQMDPDGEQIVRAMTLAIERSGRGRSRRSATSTSTARRPCSTTRSKSRCVRQLFGARADRVAGSSTKSMIGHPQGASGAAGIVTAALALPRRLPAADHQPARRRIPAATSTSSPTRSRRAGRGGAVQLPRVRLEEQRDRAWEGQWSSSVRRARCRTFKRAGFGMQGSGFTGCTDAPMDDVLICGAGPAGSIAAIVLARAGARVQAGRSGPVPARQAVRRHVESGGPGGAGAARAGRRRGQRRRRSTGMIVTGDPGCGWWASTAAAMIAAGRCPRAVLDARCSAPPRMPGSTSRKACWSRAPVLDGATRHGCDRRWRGPDSPGGSTPR